MADDASRPFHLSDKHFLSYFNYNYPQNKPFKLVILPPAIVSPVIFTLLRQTHSMESLRIEPPPVIDTGVGGKSTQLSCASTPYSKPPRTRYQLYKSSSTEFDRGTLQPVAIKSGLEQLKSTYGLLHRRISPWGPRAQSPD